MISFQPTADDIAFVDVAKKFATNTLRPIMREVESAKEVPDAIVKELGELGFLQMEERENMGGLELSMTTQVQIQRALATGDLAIIQGLPGLNDSASFFRVMEDYIKINAKENQLPTIAYISATKESPLPSLTFQQNVLSGVSLPIRGAKIATHFLIAVKNELQQTILLLLPNNVVNGTVVGESRLGLYAANIGSITFEETTINDDHIVAVGDKADTIIQEAEARIQVLQAAKQVGLMEAACHYATEYTATRKAFGQEIAKFQAVSFRIAKMVIEKRVTNHFVLEAAQALDEKQEDALQKAKKTIFQAHKAVKYVTDSAVQLLGGHGFVQDYPVEKWMRDAQAQVMLYENEHRLRLAYGMDLIDISEEVVMG